MSGSPAKQASGAISRPETGTVERWAWDYLHADTLEYKFAPPAVPAEWEDAPPCRHVNQPSRPPPLDVSSGADKTPRSLKHPRKRAQLIHAFLHHELQAAELMCWAVLVFVDTPREFRRGLVGICRDEIRHMGMYRRYLHDLGFSYGDFSVRDWFWERIPSCTTALHFVATLGIGLEGGNLDHTARFAVRFREAGDEVGAQLQERVGAEEVAHVRFALKWFRQWAGSDDFDVWRAQLPSPLSPILMRGRPLNVAERRRAGMSDSFVVALDAWVAQ